MTATINKATEEIIVRARKRKTWSERLEEYKAKGFQTDEFGVTINGTRYYKMA